MPKTYKPSFFVFFALVLLLLFPILKCRHDISLVPLVLYSIFLCCFVWLLRRFYFRYLICSIDIKDEGILFVENGQEELYRYNECYRTHIWLICKNRKLCIIGILPKKLLKRLAQKIPNHIYSLKVELEEIKELKLMHPTIIVLLHMAAVAIFFLACWSQK